MAISSTATYGNLALKHVEPACELSVIEGRRPRVASRRMPKSAPDVFASSAPAPAFSMNSVRLLFLAAASVALCLCISAILDSRVDLAVAPNGPATSLEVTVDSGDSLWSIASDYASDPSHIDVLVHEIRIVNGLDSSSLQPGMTLIIPGSR